MNLYSQRQNILLIYDYARHVYNIGTKIDFYTAFYVFELLTLPSMYL